MGSTFFILIQCFKWIAWVQSDRYCVVFGGGNSTELSLELTAYRDGAEADVIRILKR